MGYGKASFDSFAVDFNADDLALGIGFANSLQQFNGGDWAGSKPEINQYRSLNRPQQRQGSDEAIDSA